MSFRLQAIAGLSMFMLAVPVSAADALVRVYGAATVKCGTWRHVKEKDPSAYRRYGQWVAGYVSGANYYNPEGQAAPADFDALSPYIDAYCQKNPLHPLALAAAALVQTSGGPKARHDWQQ